MGIHGFAGIQSILYHLQPPTRIREVETYRSGEDLDAPLGARLEEQGPLRHRLLNTADIEPGGDAVDGRLCLMANSDVALSVARPTQAMSFWYRFAHGDETIFVHDGSGVLETQFGTLRYRKGDYLVLPTGVLWRMLPDDGVEHRLFVIEAFGHIEPPKRYLNRYGQFLETLALL